MEDEVAAHSCQEASNNYHLLKLEEEQLSEDIKDDQTNREANKVCGVCGDRALGYNFNAVSCESCKAFFRRNALKNKDFRCPFSENCNITPVTRRFCQKCRLDKCFSIGMRKECIMSEEDKAIKRQKIEQNRARKRQSTAEWPKDAIPAKRNNIRCDEDTTMVDTETSVSASTTSSFVSDKYFWESEKYIEMDNRNRQPVIENMSPVTAASVPSPSSPPENSDIIGSKTLDMLKDSHHTSEMNFVRFHEYSRSQVKRHFNSAEVYDSKFEPETGKETTHNVRSGQNDFDEEITKREICKKPKDCCILSKKAISRIAQEPKLIFKLINNPNLIAKILENNQDLVLKIMTDPSTINKLAADPQVSQFLEEIDEQNMSNVNDILEDDNISNDKSGNNPILTNLITNKKSNVEERRSVQNMRQEVYDVTKDVLQDVQSIPIAANSIESILCEAIKLEFSAYSSLGGNLSSRELNDAERAKLNELIVANKALLAPLDDDITNLVGEECRFKDNTGQSDPMLLDVINLTAIAIRRLIKMSKKINAFKNMCQEDQLALLKGGCTEMMILRSAINYDPDKDMWKIPHSQQRMSEIKADILKEAKGNLYAEHARFVRTFDPRWRDENIILILSAIALFTPDRPRVVHSDVIKLEQNSYYYLLRRYLESVYAGCEAKSMFLKLIQKISELHRLNDEVVGVYLNVNPSSVEPLLIEIFDLKH